jgi:hypothetical protein
MKVLSILIELSGSKVVCDHHQSLYLLLFFFFNTSYCTRSTQYLYACYPITKIEHRISPTKECGFGPYQLIGYIYLEVLDIFPWGSDDSLFIIKNLSSPEIQTPFLFKP